jgi:hypothetical protein
MTSITDLYIDFQLLFECSSIEHGKLSLYYENPPQNTGPLVSQLRVALRAMGYKIERIENIMDSDLKLVWLNIYTDVPELVAQQMTAAYNAWNGEVVEDRIEEPLVG